MNTDLSTVSSVDLAKMEVAISERGRDLSTKEGKTEAQLWAVKLIEYLACSGYKLPSVDKELMAKIWADQLTDAIIIYGYDDIARVVKVWAQEDDREYKQFPTTGTILAKIKELLGNPVAEIARRNHEAEVQNMVAREREELLGSVTPEEFEQIKKKYEEAKK